MTSEGKTIPEIRESFGRAQTEIVHGHKDALDAMREERTLEDGAYLDRRTDELRGRLFKVEDAGALSRAALATDTELGTLLEMAAHAGNAELGRAAFVAAEQR